MGQGEVSRYESIPDPKVMRTGVLSKEKGSRSAFEGTGKGDPLETARGRANGSLGLESKKKKIMGLQPLS